MNDIDIKYENLKSILRDYGKIVIAYSGGVDSTFLAKVAFDTLGENAIAVMILSSMNPNREVENAKIYANNIGIDYREIEADEFENSDFVKNDSMRCYYCKKHIFQKLLSFVHQLDFSFVAEGSNLDDKNDYRPGLKAIAELSIKSPLFESGFTKAEIRQMSKRLNLPTWDKPSFACLASRIPYGIPIDYNILKMIETAENFLIDLGFKQMRVRYHNDIARIELLPEDIKNIFKDDIPVRVNDKFKEIGFKYVAVDILGYRMGSMNNN